MAQAKRKNIILAILVISLAFGICYVKLKYFLRPKEVVYKKHTEAPPTISTLTQHSDQSSVDTTTKPAAAVVKSFDGPIHIATSVDGNDIPAVPTMLNSIRQHHSSHDVIVHILVAPSNSSQLKSLIKCCEVDKDLEIDVHEFALSKDFKDLIRVTGSTSIYGHLSSYANFARFFLSEAFPSIQHILYLDIDQIVQHDIGELWAELITGDQLITSTTIPSRTYGTYLKPVVKEIYDKRHSASLDLSTPCIIGGMYGVNLKLWRELDIDKDILFWMSEHHKRNLWSLGTQPLLMLVGYGRMKIVDKRWNLTGLGWDKKFNPEELNNFYILHWNGKRKPWLKDGLYQEAWSHYTPELYSTCIGKASS